MTKILADSSFYPLTNAILWYNLTINLQGVLMNIQNLNLSEKHFSETVEVLKTHNQSIEQSGDTILVLEDETRVLVIFRMKTYLVQYLDRLI